MRALVTGGTGFIGRRLIRRLTRPVVLTRDPAKAQAMLGPDIEAVAWDAVSPPPRSAFKDVDTVINLAGESVGDRRWTKKQKQRILESRVEGTRHLVESMRLLDTRPRVLVSASAVGFYGDRGDTGVDELSEPGQDFLAQVCAAWEKESKRASELGLRVVNPRIGLVLGEGGGALARMLTPFRWCVGGRLGNGRQWMPWVHIDDVVGLLLHAAWTQEMTGPMNAVSPSPVTNREFTRVLAATLGRPAFLPVPWFALRMVIGEFANALLMSQRAMPQVALRSGYKFLHSNLEEALRAILPGGQAVA